MCSRLFVIRLVIVLAFVINSAVTLFLPVRRAQAQQTPFLVTPYYGNEAITSRFDHEYPTYGGTPNNNNNIFTKFTGERWTDPPDPVNINDCNTNGVNRCYDGHNGIDFGLSYERVLAAAAGTVRFAGWQDLNNRVLGYGLHIEIDHGNGYITRYAHLTNYLKSHETRPFRESHLKTHLASR